MVNRVPPGSNLTGGFDCTRPTYKAYSKNPQFPPFDTPNLHESINFSKVFINAFMHHFPHGGGHGVEVTRS